MARRNFGYYGDQPPRYECDCPEPAFVMRDGSLRPYYGADVPVTFRQPPFDDDGFIQDFRRQQPDFGRAGHLPNERVLVLTEEDQSGAAGPWWQNPDFPHGGHNGYCIEPDCTQLQCSDETTVEFYAPLCCDKCERRVKANLINSPGVESVTADQWEKKVVVVGRNLLPDDLLRRLQRQRDMSRSTLWEHRPQ